MIIFVEIEALEKEQFKECRRLDKFIPISEIKLKEVINNYELY